MAGEFDLKGIPEVQRNLRRIFRNKEAAVYALCQFYQARALHILHEQQGFGRGVPGRYWTNQTSQAIQRAFGRAFRERNVVGWLLAHGVQYGVYLELANDRQNEALWPIVESLVNPFLAAVKRIYEG